ncbi:hypothetical protein [Nonomuraea sp. SYSU D8015]|uniref:hypothetical protein n=1 Tax=Nonomuraea sp. SYSU D8015 TaxID=2593644 RepID=UPI001660A624|nr:hypothetical protein [Nonomuraea sp. SYSU D8015]
MVIHPDNTPAIADVAEALDNIGLAVISTVTKSEDPRINAIIAAEPVTARTRRGPG